MKECLYQSRARCQAELPVSRQSNERLIDLLLRTGSKVPHLCDHTQLGPIQTCDTCMVEVDGQLVRACATIPAGLPTSYFQPVRAWKRKGLSRAPGSVPANNLQFSTPVDEFLANAVGTWSANENFYAGYAMYTITSDKLTVEGGQVPDPGVARATPGRNVE